MPASSLLRPLIHSKTARAADQFAIEELAIPGLVLMEHAGRAVAEAVLQHQPKQVVVLAGPGNNGGDGWSCARHLWMRGIPAPVLTTRAPDRLDGDASLCANMFLACAERLGFVDAAIGGPFLLLDLADDIEAIIRATGATVVVDALFGIGLSRPVEGVAARAISAINAAGKLVVSVDVPSGLPTDGEAPRGPHVFAHHTITFGAEKLVHVSEPGRMSCGDVHVVDIGVPPPPADAWVLHSPAALITQSPRLAHKGQFGHVGVWLGEYAGAARLAARAALRAGAGVVSILRDVDRPLELHDAEVMCKPLASKTQVSALVVGPGSGTHASALLPFLADIPDKPLVVDAEALDVFVRHPHAGACVLTPHPGEAARLLSTTSAEVQRDRVTAARALNALFGGNKTVVLKGACPIVIDDARGLVVVEGGAPALATAGSGDVLAGCIGALLARGMPAHDAALLGVAAHQRAGRALPERGALASDIADALAKELAFCPPISV